MAVKQRLDTPTNNFATLNPLMLRGGTLSEGNLKLSGGGNNTGSLANLSIPKTGKYYVEVRTNDTTDDHAVFLRPVSQMNMAVQGTANAVMISSYSSAIGVYVGNPYVSLGSVTETATTEGDVLGYLIDIENRTITITKNGSHKLTVTNWTPLDEEYIIGYNVSSTWPACNKTFNFGQDPTFAGTETPIKVYTDARGLGRFYYQPPEGALALCTANLGVTNYKSAPTSYVSDETNTKILTYNGNVEQVPYSPYATDGYSIHFDSNNASSQIRTSTNSDLEFAANDFTVEFWLYHTGGDSNETIVSYPQWGGGNLQNGTAWQIRLSSSNTLLTDFGSGSAWRYEGNHTDLTLKQYDWNHIVLQRDDADIKIYCNGKPSSSFWNIGSGTAITDSAEFNPDFLCIGGYSGGQNLGGYIADFRIVNGTAVYTPVSGYISAPSSKLPTLTAAIANTKFLLSTDSKKFEDLSGTGKTVTTNNTPSIEAWSPYTTDAIEFGTEYRTPETAHEIGSFSFDGSGDYLEIAGTNNLQLASASKVYVGIWAYLKSVPSNTYHAMIGSSTSGGDGHWWFGFYNNDLNFGINGQSPLTYSITGSYLNSWHHFAFTKDGNTGKLWMDGNEVASGTSMSNYINDSNQNIRLNYMNSASGGLVGYFTEPIIKSGINSSSVGGTSDTNISAAKISTDGNTKFLLQPYKSYDADNLLTSNFSYNKDSSPIPKSLTYVNDTKIVDESPYKSGANGSFSVTGNDNLILDDSDDWDLGTSFTVECWFYGKGSTSTNLQYLMSKWENAKQYNWYFTTTSAPFGQLKFEYDNGSNSFTDGGTFTTGMVANRWYHLAFVNNSGTTKLYINGVAASGTGTIGSSVNLTTDKLRIFRNVDPNKGCNALIADFRIAKGKAVYTTNFTPPHDSLTTTGGTYASSAGINNPSTSETVLLLQPGALASNDPAKKPFEHFKVVKWAGTGASNDSDNKTFSSDSSTWTNTNHEIDLDFTPDYVWAKARNSAQHWNIIDSVRGDNKVLTSSTSGSQYDVNTSQGGGLYSIANKGFTLDSGTGAGNNYHSNLNDSSYNSVAFCFKAGGKTPSKTYYVKSVGSKYRFIDDVTNSDNVELNIQRGGTYTFDLSDSSNGAHPFKFASSSSNPNSNIYETDVTYKINGSTVSGSDYVTNFNATSTTSRQIIISPSSSMSATSIYYYCTVHGYGMGGQINITTTHGQTEFGGSIIPIVSANKEAGFSIAKWVGNNTNNASISHGLTKTPDIVVLKNTSDTTNWGVKLNPNTISAVSNEQQYLYFNLTNPFGTNTYEETQLTSSLIKFVGTSLNFSNGSGDNMIAYCWHSVPGYSAFGSYAGNSSADNAFVYTGFKPAFVMLKCTASFGSDNGFNSWTIIDNARSQYNPVDIRQALWANSSNREGYRTGNNAESNFAIINFLSNGFKIIDSSYETGQAYTYIYVAFAEAPVNFSNAR